MNIKNLGNQNNVARLYQNVIDDVATNTREIFLDEGADESIIQLFKQTWESKVAQTRAVEHNTLGASRQQSQAAPVYVFANQAAGPAGNSKEPLTQQLLQYRIPSMPPPTHTQLSGPASQAVMTLPANFVLNNLTQVQPGQTTYMYGKKDNNDGKKDGDNGSNNPSAVIQVDGSSDEPSTSKRSLELQGAGPSCLKLVKMLKKKKKKRPQKIVIQFDGRGDDSSSSDEDNDDDDEDDDDDDEDEEDDEDEDSEEKALAKRQEEPELGSDDDVSTDEDPSELFDTENVVVCQYDKIHRTKCRWKFNLKVGIMSLNGHDHVFQKATGEAQW